VLVVSGRLGPEARAALLKVHQLFETPHEADLVLRNLARGLASHQEEECIAAIRTCRRDAVAFGIDLDELAERLAEFFAAWMESQMKKLIPILALACASCAGSALPMPAVTEPAGDRAKQLDAHCEAPTWDGIPSYEVAYGCLPPGDWSVTVEQRLR
jgi:hypothetical protein